MIYGIGETVFDIIFQGDQPQRAVAGGSTFNSMISLGRCGMNPVMVTETGDDRVGDIVRCFMQQNGVQTHFVTVHPHTKTPLSLAFLNEQNDAHYQFYRDPATAGLQERFPEFGEGDIVLFGSYFSVNPAIRNYTREFLLRARAAGAILYYDVNFRPAHRADLPRVKANIEENMQLSTIVRASTEDLATIYGSQTEDVLHLYRQEVEHRCPFFICTNGGEGVTVYHHDRMAHYATPRIETVSTIGAGDNFNAGIISSILHQHLTHVHLAEPTRAMLTALVTEGQRFAATVCQSLDNYVPVGFADGEV